jgi:hypothetical protein
MGKYSPLRIFLENSKKNNEVLTVQELEKILGFSLPNSALVRREWWGNEVIQNTRHTHCKAWINAGWKVENVSLGFNVIFSKINRG